MFLGIDYRWWLFIINCVLTIVFFLKIWGSEKEKGNITQMKCLVVLTVLFMTAIACSLLVEFFTPFWATYFPWLVALFSLFVASLKEKKSNNAEQDLKYLREEMEAEMGK